MTSKISFAKLLREDMKRRSWLLALCTVAFFLLGPVICLMNLESQFRRVRLDMGQYTLKDVKEWFLGFVGFNNGLLMAAVCICAVLCAVTGYQYLHSRTKVDLFHSIPVKREKFFLVQYVSGILFFLIPYVLCMVLCLLIGAFQGVVTARHVLYCTGSIGLGILYFLMIYHVAILAMMLTGKLLVGILGTAVFCGAGTALSMLQTRLFQSFYDTYFTTVSETGTAIRSALSPIEGYFYAAGRLGTKGKFPGVFLLAALMIAILLLALDLWLYKRRASEAAESAMAFSKTEGIVKVCMIVPASLWAGLLMGSFNTYDSSVNIGWFIFGVLVSLLLLHTIVEFIYHMDFREILRKKWSLLAAAVLAFGCSAVFFFDLTGYDSYLPREDKIDGMSVYTSNFNGRFSYPYDSELSYNTGSEQRILDQVKVKDFQMIYDLAQEGVKNKNLRKEVYAMEESRIAVSRAKLGETSSEEQYDNVFIKYHLKSGRDVYRRYFVKYESSEKCIEQLCNNKEYKESLFPINYVKEENVTKCTLTDRYQRETILKLTDEEKARLIRTFREEQNNASYETMTQGPIAGVLSMEVKEDEYSTSMYQYSISPGYTDTIALLREFGNGMDEQWKPEYAESIQITNYYESGTNTPPTASFTEKEDIAEILGALTWGGEYGPVKEGTDYSVEVDVTWSIDGARSNGVYYFTEGKIPECVIRAFE